MPVIKVKLHGQELLWVEEDGVGALATPEAFRDGTASYAHVFPDGNIMRFGKVIAQRTDLERGEEVPLERALEGLTLDSFGNVFMHPSWDGPEDTPTSSPPPGAGPS